MTDRPDIAADVVRRVIAKTPGARESDLTVTCTETATDTVLPPRPPKLPMIGRPCERVPTTDTGVHTPMIYRQPIAEPERPAPIVCGGRLVLGIPDGERAVPRYEDR